MKPTTTPVVLAVAMFLLAGVVSAHDQSGSLGKGSRNVDFYQAECFDDGTGEPDYLELRVIDTADTDASSVISVQVIKGIVAYNTTDNGPDGDTRYSPWIKVRGGSGLYQVLVGKNKEPGDDYVLEYHCKTKSNAHTGALAINLQNK